MADEQDPSSSWWGYASSAWNAMHETAKDFTDAFQEENEETIEQIKSKVDTEQISNQISTATNSINAFLNTTVTSINTTLNQNTTNLQQDVILKKQISPKPFEKEKATYVLDPFATKQHKDKYNKFIEKDLDVSDDDICLKGRHLLQINGAIRTYFQQLVPEEIDEITFWKRYFYWKHNNQLREILISRHTKPNKPDIETGDKDEEEEQDAKLNDCENAKITDYNDETHNNKVEKAVKNNGNNTEESATGSKFSETYNKVNDDQEEQEEEEEEDNEDWADWD